MPGSCDGENCGRCPACCFDARMIEGVSDATLHKLAEATFKKILPTTYKSSSFGRARKERSIKAIYDALVAVNERKLLDL